MAPPAIPQRFRIEKVGLLFWSRFIIVDGDYEIGPFRTEREAQEYILDVFEGGKTSETREREANG